MSDAVRLVIEGVDNVGAMELREALDEAGVTSIEITEVPHRPLGAGRHGAQDTLQLILQLAAITVPAVTTTIALWLTRRKKTVTKGGFVFVAEGDNVSLARFGEAEVTQSSDPAQIAAALQQRLAPSGKGNTANSVANQARRTAKPVGTPPVKPARRRSKKTAEQSFTEK